MHGKAHSYNSTFGISWIPANALWTIMLMLLFLTFVLFLMFFIAQPAQGQTYRVIYNFTAGLDGKNPQSQLTIDTAGNLYGTTRGRNEIYGDCSNAGCGTVFELLHRRDEWVLIPIHYFTAGTDGDLPLAGVTFGPDGSLYGTTWYGGRCQLCGTVFRVRPPARVPHTALEPWTESVLYSFGANNDGTNPAGEVTFDNAGNIYGTTLGGGTGNGGIVYELTPFGNDWQEAVLHNFTWSSDDGYAPYGRLIWDGAGNLYGTTYDGGGGCGNVYELSPSMSGWTETNLHAFHGIDGCNPNAGLVSDGGANLYGAAPGGLHSYGTIFKFSKSGNSWVFQIIYDFVNGVDGSYPAGPLVMDASGNLYGTTFVGGGGGVGVVYKLSPANGGWRESVLYNFSGGEDGGSPVGGVVLDSNGNLYGTAAVGGAYGYGVVWEITP